MASIVLKCSCKDHKNNPQSARFQDERYGVGMRVFNSMATADKWRCSVCGNEQVKQGK
jgi:hypothetical protein